MLSSAEQAAFSLQASSPACEGHSQAAATSFRKLVNLHGYECIPGGKEGTLSRCWEGDLSVKDYFSQANHVQIFSSDLQFSALKVPEPVDTQTAKIDAQEQEAVSV